MTAQAPDAPETRADWADRRLRAAILTGELAPGERLLAGPLARRLAVSATPLREAIQRLAAQGLVEQTPQRGARVPVLSPAEFTEIYELRLLLEPRAARLSVAAGDGAHRASIDAAFGDLERAMRSGDVVAAIEAHARFHDTLVERCPSQWLLRLVRLLADHAQRYALASLRSGDGHYDLIGEHRALRDAAAAGDAEAAAAEVEAHLARTVAGPE